VSQALEALEFANTVRIESARIRREVGELPRRQGLLRVAELLLDPPEPIQRTRVDRLICSVRNIGADTAVRIAREAEVNPARHVGPVVATAVPRSVLTARQRHALAAELRRRAA
jgi:hypothetical protein